MNLLRALALVGAAAVMMCTAPMAGTTSTTPAPSASPSTAGQATQGPEDYTTVVHNVSPSIVLIESSSGLGSGVVLDANGDIVTNAHVAGTASVFAVTTADGKRYAATLLGSYEASDVAVIKASASGLKPATFGDSSKLEVGQKVLAMGNPLGYQSSVTDGIVSGLGRTVSEPNGALLTNVVQTSAAINPGNSGGGLVDLESEVVGVPTLVAVDPQIGGVAPGIGFALPSNTVTDYANQIIKNGKVVNTNRAYLGVQAGDVSSGGAIVLNVAPGGPAHSAGIQAGDIITAVNGQTVADASALQADIESRAPGSTVSLSITRNGTAMTVNVKLGALPAP